MIKNNQPDSKENNNNSDTLHNKSEEEHIEAIEKFFGILKLTEDPLVMQRRWRDEWED